MEIRQSFIMAVKSLFSSKLRSFLTMLGIIIGVASVIILVSVVDGMKNSMVEKFEAMGTNLISVMITNRGSSKTIKPDEIQDFCDKNQDVIGSVTPMINGSVTAKYKTDSVDTSIVGTNEFYPDVKNIEIEKGRYLEYIDILKRQKVCVIGAYISSELYDGNSLGQTIKLNGESYTIVGTVKAKEGGTEGTEDDKIYLPYTCATYLSNNRNVSSYAFSANTKENVDFALSRINAFLQDYFGSSDAYRTFSQEASLESVNELTGTMTLVLVGVAAISLLVGGIGIMNIMLVSVTERTREIGIRKSLGATPFDIMSQFTVEAGTTGSLGGILGIVLGVAGAYVTGSLMDLTVSPSATAIIVAFSVSVAIGIIFGYFPAKKAAALNPIDALKYD